MQPLESRRCLVINIDGLRQDVFLQALDGGRVPRLAELLGAQPLHLNPASTAPSITFCAQSTIFTGVEPARHGIIGNQFFDRFGLRGGGPRFYAFDVGDRLAYDDAVLTFTGDMGLVGQTMDPQVSTIYEQAARAGRTSTVVYHMVSRGATTWIRPSLVDIARFTKGGGLIGLSAGQYDGEMLEKTLEHLQEGSRPDLLTVYFMGLDHTSHHDGPGAQMEYLARVVDPLVGRLADALRGHDLLEGLLVGVVSDHGQIEVIPDDRHSLRLSFPFDREMGYLFDALGLDVHDHPLEGPDCEAVVASNGGMAQVSLRRQGGAWSDLPSFEEDVLPVGRAFWEEHAMGRYAADLRGALSAVLVRNARDEGWYAPYHALTPDGRVIDLAAFLGESPFPTLDALPRLRDLSGPVSGDLLLLANLTGGFYFGAPTTGVHGGLHPDESLCVASFGAPEASREGWSSLRDGLREECTLRARREGRAHPSLACFVHPLQVWLDLK
jgi:hypothetical protein